MRREKGSFEGEEEVRVGREKVNNDDDESPARVQREEGFRK